VSNLGLLAGLAGLRDLYLSNCGGLTDLKPLAGLGGLQYLILFRCAGLTDLEPLARLEDLRHLHLSHCDGLTDLGPLAGLAGLRELDLSNCARVTDLGPLAGLAGLRRLNLSSCSGLRHFQLLRGLLTTLKNLSLYNCHFDGLPQEVCGESPFENVLDKVRAHYEDLEPKAVEDTELKLFVLGNGGVGKTQMCRRLCNLPYDENIDTTHGVHLDSFPLTLEDHATPVTVRLWDFGGQDVYHGTHALFLQGHAVFVVLWTPSREKGDADERGVPIRHRPLAYWLDYIRGLAGADSPVLVVQSQCDDAKQRRRHPASSDDFRYSRVLEFSAKTDLGLDVLKAHIKESVRNLLADRPLHHVGAGRVKVRDKLRALLAEDQARPPAQRKHRTLTKAKFRGICQATRKVSNPDALLDFLHRTGVVFYRPGLFEDRIILDQTWALDAIYTIFDRRWALPYLAKYGRFTRQALEILAWEEYSVEEQATFLGMMLSCGVCFPLTRRSRPETETEYVAPDLLPEESHPDTQEQLSGRIPDVPADAAATVRYRFLHEGILRTLLSRIGKRARDAAVYWKYGCWFAEETTRSRVLIRGRLSTRADQPGAGEITLDAWGPSATTLIDAVLETLHRIPLGQQPEEERTDNRPKPPIPDVVQPARGVEGLVIAALPEPSTIEAHPRPPGDSLMPKVLQVKGAQHKQLVDALVNAFPSPTKLEMMLEFRLSKALADVVALPSPMPEIAFNLIKSANAEGWTGDLIAAARESNPNNPLLLLFAAEYGLSPLTAELERKVRRNLPFLDVAQWRKRLGEVEGQVCRVETPGGYGTGFLLGADVVITNYHVMESVITKRHKPAQVVLRFDYKRLDDGTTLNPGVEFRLAEKKWLIDHSPLSPLDLKSDPGDAVPGSEELDYALLRVEGHPGEQPIGGDKAEPTAPPRGWVEPMTKPFAFDPDTPLFIVQHPERAPLKLAFDTKSVIGLNGNQTRVRYRTNTEPGSSGSPVFNSDWELVALHHSGDRRVVPEFNQGIPFVKILELLKKRRHLKKLGKRG
jgi:GTPase SAR1 family protein